MAVRPPLLAPNGAPFFCLSFSCQTSCVGWHGARCRWDEVPTRVGALLLTVGRRRRIREMRKLRLGKRGGPGGEEGLFTREKQGTLPTFSEAAAVISVNIYVFALVLSVAACAALAWITFDTRKRLRDVSSSSAMTAKSSTMLCNALVKRVETVEKQSPVALGAQVAELSEAVDRLRKTHQRFAGRIDRERQLEEEPEPSDNPTYNALLKAQRGI